ncbi:TetR family transcriptional regulator C-terminal domain-containing protein [Streptomyces sp. NBC_01171]|nr:TetR family transcriptional regulator C-terminal domain-containing protein [Streptomyces sp. NBC_01171]
MLRVSPAATHHSTRHIPRSLNAYARLRSSLRPHLEAARERGELPAHAGPEQLAAAAVAFTHGLVVQALFDPGRFPEDAQVAMPYGFLASLAAS